MATTKPRMSITLDAETYNAVRKLAENKRCSMSEVIQDVCNEARPAFERINALFLAAQTLDEDAFKDLNKALNTLETRVANAYEDSVAQMDLLASQKRKPGRPRKTPAKK